jgi:hypothetical protein
MADGNDREYGHNPIRPNKVVPTHEEKGLQPIKPIVVSDDAPVQTGLQPIRPAPPSNQGDQGQGGGEKSD